MSPRLAPLPDGFAATVSALHRVAEDLVAPARKPDNEISLRATPGGFGTPEFEFDGAVHQVRVEADELVHRVDGEERRGTLSSLAAGASAIADLLPPGARLDSGSLQVDLAASRALSNWYEFGAGVLSQLVDRSAPEDEATVPRLWPEHFDIAIELGPEGRGLRANYGLSPGDEDHAEPYLYVSPWSAEVSGDLWSANGFKGAELSYADLVGEDDQPVAALGFFVTRWDALKETTAPTEEEQ
ncbi:MAG: hypothetical protein WBL45_07820 [Solirubrobacterales bacterium]